MIEFLESLEIIKPTLITLYPWFFLAYFSLFFVLLIKNFEKLRKPFKNIDRKIWVALVIILILGLFVRFEHTNLEYDWDSSTCEYRLVAKYILLENRANLCYRGSFENCVAETGPNHPAGYPFIASLIFLFFDLNIRNLLIVQILIGTATIILAFLLSYAITKDKYSGLVSAAALSFFPLHIIASGSENMGVEVFSLFFIFLLLTIFFIWKASIKAKKSDFYLNLLFLISMGLMLNIRADNIFLTIPILFYIIYNKYLHKIGKEILVALPLFISVLYHILLIWVSNLFYGRGEFSIFFLQNNLFKLAHNWSRLFSPYIYLLPFLVFFAVYKNRYKKLSIALVFWFLFYNIFYSIFFLGPGSRYILLTVLPVVLLISLGIKNAIKVLKIEKKSLIINLIIIMFVFSSIFSTQSFSIDNGNDLKNSIEKIYNENKIVVILPSGNTAWCATFESDEVFFIGLSVMNVESLEEYNNFYFLDTGRCEFIGMKEKCELVIDNSEFLYNIGRINVYKVKNRGVLSEI